MTTETQLETTTQVPCNIVHIVYYKIYMHVIRVKCWDIANWPIPIFPTIPYAHIILYSPGRSFICLLCATKNKHVGTASYNSNDNFYHSDNALSRKDIL